MHVTNALCHSIPPEFFVCAAASAANPALLSSWIDEHRGEVDAAERPPAEKSITRQETEPRQAFGRWGYIGLRKETTDLTLHHMGQAL